MESIIRGWLHPVLRPTGRYLATARHRAFLRAGVQKGGQQKAGCGSLTAYRSCPRQAASVQHVPVQLQKLDVSALLGREEVRLDVSACARYLEGRVLLVTGAAGSIGWELCRQLSHLRPRSLVLLDTNETGLFDLHAHLHAIGTCGDLVVCLADITDEQRIAQVFARYGPQVIFHAAAYKHVPLLESHPREAVTANVLGTMVLCRAAYASGVERFVFISTDKAVAPANNLGYSKRIGELLVRSFGQDSRTTFCVVRFGNVIGSQGSVVPTFERQIALGGPVTVTHPSATRFFMSLPEAASLVIQAAATTANGSIFMLDMGRPVPIASLAERMIRLHGLRVGTDIDIVFTGLRPGEKLHEQLSDDLEHTLPTAHPKIMQVNHPQPISRVDMEVAVRALIAMARHASEAQVSDALRLVSQGYPLSMPVVVDAGPFNNDRESTGEEALHYYAPLDVYDREETQQEAVLFENETLPSAGRSDTVTAESTWD